MPTKTQMLVAALAILVASGLSALAPAGGEAQYKTPATFFVAHRDGLKIVIEVSRHRIVHTETGSVVHCEEGGKEYGSITSRPWRGFKVGHKGGFAKSSWESYEGDGSYFMSLRGQVHRDRIVGYYRAWEERMGEEEWFPRCGTVTPKGEEMRFIAHRAKGPPRR